MQFLQSVIMGIVEGLSEFLPISSTYHLLVTAKILDLGQSLFIDQYIVIIQSGAMAAAILLYGKKLATNFTLAKKLFISFIPIAVFGLILHSVIKNYLFTSLSITTSSFAMIGILMIVCEYLWKNLPRTKTLEDLTIKEAMLIGLAQSFALIPGVSRSGTILLSMLGLRFKRDQAAQYTFMLGIPTIFAATAFDLLDIIKTPMFNQNNLDSLYIGWFISFVIALIAMRWLIKYLEHHTLLLFGWYRIVIGLLIFFLLS